MSRILSIVERIDMKDYIILALIVLAAFIGIIETVKHFTRRSGCCGGGGYKMKRKRLPRVVMKKKFRVEGMRCSSCAQRVEETANDIEGVSGKVDLRSSTLTVSYAHDVDDALIATRLDRLGYKITEI